MSSEVSVELGSEIFSTHNFEAPSSTVKTSKDELVGFLKEMYTMRRMEITNDTEYKVGFFSLQGSSVSYSQQPSHSIIFIIYLSSNSSLFRLVIYADFVIFMMVRRPLPAVWMLP